MKKIRHVINYLLPPIIWMTVIFYMSSRPHFGITHTAIFDFLIFKLLHMFEYAFLYMLLFRGFYKTPIFSRSRIYTYSFLLAFFYAISDEIHQLFVPTREGRMRDIMIDTAGITLAYFVIKQSINSIKKYL